MILFSRKSQNSQYDSDQYDSTLYARKNIPKPVDDLQFHDLYDHIHGKKDEQLNNNQGTTSIYA